MRRRELLGKAASAFASAYLVQAEEKSFALGSKGGKKMGPLRVHPRNPRYFADGSGRVVYLTGSHTWTNLQEGGLGKQPFDFNAYLDFLAKHNHNFIRMWSWQSVGAWIFPSISPHPWERTGPGNAVDGKPKFDLQKFNQAYFNRLRERVKAAGDRGIYVSVMMFVGGNFDVHNEWERHPFHRANNVNGIDGDIDGDGKGHECVTMNSHPRIQAVRDLEVRYVKKVIDTLNDLDNVLFEIVNEGGTKDWDWFMVRLIKDYEKTKPKQHPVGLTGHGGESNDSMLASPADWFSPGSGYWPDLKSDPRAVDGKKVSILDTDHIWGEGGNAQWVWKSFLRGHNPIYMDRIVALTGDPRGEIPGAQEVRTAMGHTRTVAERINLAEMIPHGELASSGYCLAQPGKEYLFYFPEGGQVKVDLSGMKGSASARWFNPRDGRFGKVFRVDGGGWRELAAPDEKDWVLHIYSRR